MSDIELEIAKLRQAICEIDNALDYTITLLKQRIENLIMKDDALQIQINSLNMKIDK